jgi:hypothetical protein
MFGQAVPSSTLPQQSDVAERRPAIIFVALGYVGHGGERVAADVLRFQPQRPIP